MNNFMDIDITGVLKIIIIIHTLMYFDKIIKKS